MNSNASDPTVRFSNTAEHYAKYRPGYPQEIVTLLESECGIHAGNVVADIGSGTGIFTRLLLDNGYTVFGVEPNREMREKAEHSLAQYSAFTSVASAAESTGLQDSSVDCITVATAFHWFDQNRAKIEFRRILKSNAYCVLVWNIRLSDTSPFMKGYDALVNQYGIDYKKVASEAIGEADIERFFEPHFVTIRNFPNRQLLDWEGFEGRLLSTSYMPKLGHPMYNDMKQAAKDLFAECNAGGFIEFIYSTKCYYGPFT